MSESLVLDRIQSNLTRLRLPRIGEILSETAAAFERKRSSYLSFLDALLEEEVAQKEQRRVETTLKISGLPFIKSIDAFDFTFQPRLDRQKVLSLFDLTFIREKGNVLFLGPAGVGKTHLAVALAVKACQAGMSIYATTMEALIKKLKKDEESDRSVRGRAYTSLPWCWSMRLGTRRSAGRNAIYIFKFVAYRYEKASTIITSNKAFSDWSERFHDLVIVTAVLDRLLHHSTIINIRGNSYRLKGKMGKEAVEISKPDG